MERDADETTTGSLFGARRPKATIAVRTDSNDGFTWFVAWRNDFCPQMGEVKAPQILQIAGANPAAHTRLLQGIRPCSVFIVDLLENEKVLSGPLRAFLSKPIPDDVDLLEAMNNPKTLRDLAYGLLAHRREGQLLGSSIGAIESLMSLDEFDAALRKAGLADFAGDAPRECFDRNSLMRLSERDFLTLVGRFSVALADALSPQAQARAIASAAGHRWLQPGHIAFQQLSEPVSHDYVFDQAGSRKVTAALEEAHGEVVDFLRGHQNRTLMETLRPGTISEADSVNVLGIQVADVAARFAAEVFEGSGLPGLQVALRLREHFDHVFLNKSWIAP